MMSGNKTKVYYRCVVRQLSPLRISAGGDEYYHPGRKATVSARNQTIAQLGEIHPDYAEQFDISARMYVAEIDLAAACGFEEITLGAQRLRTETAAVAATVMAAVVNRS